MPDYRLYGDLNGSPWEYAVEAPTPEEAEAVAREDIQQAGLDPDELTVSGIDPTGWKHRRSGGDGTLRDALDASFGPDWWKED